MEEYKVERIEFEKNINEFVKELRDYVSSEDGEWTIKGFIDIYKNIYTISSDTKIISKILEIHIFPEILRFADKIGYGIMLAEHQNWYPDITFINKENESIKFAFDIKTTFRRGNGTAGFTLGSHGSYFKERDKKKNIQFPYNHYSGHYCLGIIYTRADFENELNETEVFNVKEINDILEEEKVCIGERQITEVENLKSITSVIRNFDFFASPKWKIASDKQGSGNTANIGSVTNIESLKNGKGVFSNLGEKWFDEYWMNYGVATMMKGGESIKIKNISDFLEFKGRKDLLEKVVTRTVKRKKNE